MQVSVENADSKGLGRRRHNHRTSRAGYPKKLQTAN